MWQPLLPEGEVDQARAVIEAIAHDLERVIADPPPERPPLARAGLSRGLSGVALFFATLDRDARDRELARAALDRASRIALGESPSSAGFHSLYTGATGVAWVGAYVANRWGESDPQLASAAMRRVEETAPSTAEPPGGAELVRGAAGEGVFGLELSPDGRHPMTRRAVEIARRELESALALSEPIHPSAAHGTAGIVAFLAQAETDAPALALCERVVRRMSAPLLDPPVAERRGTHCAWCHGELGVAGTLMAAAVAADRKRWSWTALAIAKRAALRLRNERALGDACLCHGAAGAAHLFGRLHALSGDGSLVPEARHWLRRTIRWRFATGGSGYGGYRALQPRESGRFGFVDAAGFLPGAAGIGLVLIASMRAEDPSWDRALLVSPLPSPATPRTRSGPSHP